MRRGGCRDARRCRRSRDGARATARFGFSDADAHAAGLACGGAIDVDRLPADASTDAVAVDALEAVLRDEAVAVGLVISERVHRQRRRIGDPLGRIVPVTVDGPRGQHPDPVVTQPRPRLVILGAGDYAAALCRAAAVGGFAVTVCDAWGLLVTPERFPDADAAGRSASPRRVPSRVIGAPLDPRTAICVLTHDERQDVPGAARSAPAARRIRRRRWARAAPSRAARELLRAQGVTDDELARLHSPLGLDLGAETPEETAISILAEIIAARRAGTGTPAAGAGDADPRLPGRSSGRTLDRRRRSRLVLRHRLEPAGSMTTLADEFGDGAVTAEDVVHLEHAIRLAAEARARGDHPFGAIVVAPDGDGGRGAQLGRHRSRIRPVTPRRTWCAPRRRC